VVDDSVDLLIVAVGYGDEAVRLGRRDGLRRCGGSGH